MFTLRKRATFEAAHMLPQHDGKCARLHGHSWVVEVELRGHALHDSGPKVGMLEDFGDLKAVLKDLVEERLDHYYLNESVPELASPTSEALAYWIYWQLKPHLPRLAAVTINETCTSAAEYRP
jgi:6-pyruvoyltetrahydropterin/6-carboxytetrahydropterin synthase